jgi:hypothetical protein
MYQVAAAVILDRHSQDHPRASSCISTILTTIVHGTRGQDQLKV